MGNAALYARKGVSNKEANSRQGVATVLQKRLAPLWPLSAGKQEIRALDGLRGVAALSVLFFHAMGLITQHLTLLGYNLTFTWYYTQTGVDLFFVLSGFLLFMPYARAMLQADALPSTGRFFRRRALRILPAYWVCLAVLVLIQLPAYLSVLGLENVVTHIFLLHDDFPTFNRAIEGPFWTLAVEAQFYLLLPLIAAGMTRFVGKTRSLARLVGAILALMLLALVVRELDAVGQRSLPHLPGAIAMLVQVLVRSTMGSQGKFLAVFAVGMLCSTLYIATSEGIVSTSRLLRWLGRALLVGTGGAIFVLGHIAAHNYMDAPNYLYVASQPGNLELICGPWLIGLGYGVLVLGVLWSGHIVHALFEMSPLRFSGLISYSLYLWHAPILFGQQPFTSGWPLLLRILTAFAVAYASYQLVERPFLKRRWPAKAGRSERQRQVQPGTWTSAEGIQGEDIQREHVTSH
jgi:peptidoglycan/LPS O-acetylase OafA/YrhL